MNRTGQSTGKRCFSVHNPYDNAEVGSAYNASKREVCEALALTHGNKDKLSIDERVDLLEKLHKLVSDSGQIIAKMISKESGLALRDTTREVNRTLSVIEECRKYVPLLGKDLAAKFGGANGPRLKVICEPLDLAIAITPFNHPLNQVIHKIGPAIVANANIVVKPSEKTPLTAIWLHEQLLDLGLPVNQVNIVTGTSPKKIVDTMVTSPMVEMVAFTGSVEVGKSIAKKISQSDNAFAKQIYELGGNAALIVTDSADIEKAANLGMDAFWNSGQRCTAVNRIIVTEGVADEFVSSFAGKAEKLSYGNPLDPRTDVGTVISESAAKNMERKVNSAISDGAKLLLGNVRDGALYSPTVLDDVNPSSELVSTEIFGPVAPVIRVGKLADAISIVNSSRHKLAGAIVTEDEKEAIICSSAIRVGQFNWNGPPGFRYEQAPFGGFGTSGNYRKEGVILLSEEFTRMRTYYEH